MMKMMKMMMIFVNIEEKNKTGVSIVCNMVINEWHIRDIKSTWTNNLLVTFWTEYNEK